MAGFMSTTDEGQDTLGTSFGSSSSTSIGVDKSTGEEIDGISKGVIGRGGEHWVTVSRSSDPVSIKGVFVEIASIILSITAIYPSNAGLERFDIALVKIFARQFASDHISSLLTGLRF